MLEEVQNFRCVQDYRDQLRELFQQYTGLEWIKEVVDEETEKAQRGVQLAVSANAVIQEEDKIL